MICGACGGEIRGYSGTLHGRPIKDWKHRSVPPGTTPHRPILGTPVDQDTLDRIHRPRVTEADVSAAVVERPQIVETIELTDIDWADWQSVNTMLRIMELEHWSLVGFWLRVRSDGVEYLVMKARRRDLGATVLWRFNGEKLSWEFHQGWALTSRGVHQVQSTSLKAWFKTRDEACPDCGRSSIMHGEECP